ncbi:MAG TPA: ABC transporter permease [Ktedonobacterales bacterium]|nr:ABC transporter permease [Ktedonobacterales bacterium]
MSPKQPPLLPLPATGRRQPPRTVPKQRAARSGSGAVSYWWYRVWRNIRDQPWRSLSIVIAVLVGIAIAIAIIAASNGIEHKINELLQTNSPDESQSLRRAGVNLDDIQAVLSTTRDLLTKLAIGFTAALVGLVTWVNTSQRRRAIGISMQQGQHREEVIVELLGESLILCSIGGILGVVTGNALCAFVNHESPLLPMQPGVGDVLAIFPATTLLAFAVTAVIAFIFSRFVDVAPAL